MTSHGAQDAQWQTPRNRGRSTGARHWVSFRLSDAPESAPMHPMIVTDAAFSLPIDQDVISGTNLGLLI
jgi:hypothetical protein